MAQGLEPTSHKMTVGQKYRWNWSKYQSEYGIYLTKEKIEAFVILQSFLGYLFSISNFLRGFILFRGLQIEAIFAGWLKPLQNKREKTNLDWDNVETSVPEKKKSKSVYKRVVTYEKARFVKEVMFMIMKHHNSW